MRLDFLTAGIFLFSALIVGGCSYPSSSDVRVEDLVEEAGKTADPKVAEATLQKAVLQSQDGRGIVRMKALNALSSFYEKQGQTERCLDLYQQAREVGDTLLAHDSNAGKSAEFQKQYAAAFVGLANYHRDLGHFASAVRFYDLAGRWTGALQADSPMVRSLNADRQRCFEILQEQEVVDEEMLKRKKKTSGGSKTFSESQKEREAFLNAVKQTMNNYGKLTSSQAQKTLLDLAVRGRAHWGKEDPYYSFVMQALIELSDRTRDFHSVDTLLNEDFATVSSVNRATQSFKRLSDAEIVEVGGLVDTLARLAQVSIAKFDWKQARSRAERALRLANEYYPEDGLRRELCLRSLSEVERFDGNYDIADKFDQEAIGIVMAVEPANALLITDSFHRAVNLVNQGKLPQAVSLAESLHAQRQTSEDAWRAYDLCALRILFEVKDAMGDEQAALATSRAAESLIEARPHMYRKWFSEYLYRRTRLLIESGNFEALVKLREANLADPKLYLRDWLRDCDLLAYACLMSRQTEKSKRYLQKVCTAKTDAYARSLYYSRIVEVWNHASAKDKAGVAGALSALLAGFDRTGHPGKLRGVLDLTRLADHLAVSGFSDDAEKVYLTALSVYDKVPGKVDEQLIALLRSYEALLAKQGRTGDVFQIKTRLEQKTKKLATVRKVTSDAIDKSKLSRQSSGNRPR